MLTCHNFLSEDGDLSKANIKIEDKKARLVGSLENFQSEISSSYLVNQLPVEFHCHGLREYDFSNFQDIDLDLLNTHAIQEGIYIIPSIFLPKPKFDLFIEFLKGYDSKKHNHILGFSLEGPLLSSFAGTPQTGNWMLSKVEWESIFKYGKNVIKYIVISPDVMHKSSFLYSQISSNTPSLSWIVNNMFKSNILPALGHISKIDIDSTYEEIKNILRIASKYNKIIVTDHLFNDMPVNFKHAWRSVEEKKMRFHQIKNAHLEKWSIENIESIAGKIPGLMMKEAIKGNIKLCLNFDGEHVDLEIAKKVIEFVGSKNIIAMTDRLDQNKMCGYIMHKKEANNLWYQSKHIVSAGSSTIDVLIHNLRAIGCSEKQIWNMVSFNIFSVFDLHTKDVKSSYLNDQRERFVIEEIIL